jgi:hypothetical protein
MVSDNFINGKWINFWRGYIIVVTALMFFVAGVESVHQNWGFIIFFSILGCINIYNFSRLERRAGEIKRESKDAQSIIDEVGKHG